MKISFAIIGMLLAPDAFAWGLQTHVFLGQWMLAAAPFANPQFRAAVLRLPRLVLAGACLPDLALAGKMQGVGAFKNAHRWSTLRRLAGAGDEERAIAVGYASHLLADVIAHNRFVPDHEARILHLPHVTHAICEWAMDEHLSRGLHERPADLLLSQMTILAPIAAAAFDCREGMARRTLHVLACAERALRTSPLPRWCGHIVRSLTSDVAPRFDAYIGDAAAMVRRIEGVLRGAEPRWDPEPEPGREMATEAPA